jgi:hypothetical protein
MHSQKNDQQDNKHHSGFAGYAGKHLLVSVVVVVGVIWVLSVVLDRLNLGQHEYGNQPKTGHSEPQDPSQSPGQTQKPLDHSTGDQQTTDFDTTADTADRPIKKSSDQASHPNEASDPAYRGHGSTESVLAANQHASIVQRDDPKQETSSSEKTASSRSPGPIHETGDDRQQVKAAAGETHGEADQSKHPTKETKRKEMEDRADHEAADQDRQDAIPQKTEEKHEPAKEAPHVQQPRGVAFVEAVMQPLDHELNHRFWGWRPNDIINVTDNVNNSQLGILEVTRRTVVQLTQRISRTGSTDAFNPHLEKAMNWLMVKADRYWFPAPESKYQESLEELTIYKEMLINGKASFYIRTDNLIPLLTEYEDLLGSCDENLVKAREDDGSAVSFFKADDYFYYARGVASAMAVILKAVHHDFLPTLDSRHGSELLHHAIISCETAAKLSPLIIIDSDLDGFFANHRANMAAPISHARFYISQLIKTLST